MLFPWWKLRQRWHQAHQAQGGSCCGGESSCESSCGCGSSSCSSCGSGSAEQSASGCGPRGGGYESHDSDDGGFGGGAFGVRRPLRFLAYKLGLDEKQVNELAAVLNDLKTERAQSAVDDRRTTAGFADAVAGTAFGDDKAGEAAQMRVKSAERLRDAVVKALKKIHAILNDEQRTKLAYMIRTGTLII